LRLNLLEEYDMVLVPEAVWKRLQKWYGGAPEILRKVITTGYYIKKKIVEIYLLAVKIVYNAKPGEVRLGSRLPTCLDFRTHRAVGD
jgi:hypothetical protein